MSLKIQDFIKQYDNYPILFVGAGLSLRYLEGSYTWDGLLKKIASDVFGNTERYLNIKSNNYDNHKIRIGEGSSIRVSIATDYEDLPDDQKVLAIGHLQIETANVARMLPQKVRKKVNEKIDKTVMKEVFTQPDLTALINIFQIQGIKENKIYTKPPKTKYCIFDEANEKYLYTEAWVDFIVDNINDGKLSKAEWKKWKDNSGNIIFTKDIDNFIAEV